MRIQKNILFWLAVALVLLLPASGQAAYDLNGDWTFSYSVPSGESFSDPCVIQQTSNRFNGQTTYYIEGQAKHDTFEGLVNPDGSVVFTLYEAGGDPVYHRGQISPDGNTITGSWSIGDSSGSFTISRGVTTTTTGTTTQSAGAIDLSGDWSFSFTNPEGKTFTDPAVIKQNGNRISGTLSYDLNGQMRTEPFEGTVSPDGTVDLTLNDKGTLVQHTGKLSPDGNTVTGNWSIEGGAGGPFTMTRAGANPPATLPSNPPATSPYNLNGEWVFSFDAPDGASYSDPCTIQQNGDQFSGLVSYYKDGEEFHEPFEGTINPDGSVEFTLYDMEQPVLHTGKLSPDGNTISGTWSYDDGSGTFTITRGGYVTGLPAPNTPSQGDVGVLSGNWTFNSTMPDGTSYSDQAVITQTGNHFTGTVTYVEGSDSSSYNFDGTIKPDGSVEFTLHESKEPVVHWGQLSPDGNTISGEWSVANGSGTFSLVRN